MYIQHDGIADPDRNVGTTAMQNDQTLGERVEFNPETGKARVTKDVGESMAQAYEDIRIVDREDGDADGDGEE